MCKRMIETGLKYYKQLRTKIYTVIISKAFHSVGSKASISPPLRFGNLSRIQLGNRVTIHENCWLQVITNHEDIFESPNIIMADDVSIGMSSTISAAKRITFEEYVFTARNFYVSDHEHEFHDVSCPIAVQGISKIREVRIGARTWIGQNVVVLPGVTIGRHCVIAANSVVRQDVPDYSIAGGAPARVLRTYSEATGNWEKVGV